MKIFALLALATSMAFAQTSAPTTTKAPDAAVVTKAPAVVTPAPAPKQDKVGNTGATGTKGAEGAKTVKAKPAVKKAPKPTVTVEDPKTHAPKADAPKADVKPAGKPVVAKVVEKN